MYIYTTSPAAPPSEVEAVVAKLNAIDPPKAKKATAAAPPPSGGAAGGSSAEADALIARHNAQGKKVRLAKEAVKSGSGTKETVDAEVKALLAIKAEYKVRV